VPEARSRYNGPRREASRWPPPASAARVRAANSPSSAVKLAVTEVRTCAIISAMSQSTQVRITAFVFAVSVALWTIAPVCGTPSDVNPEACCERGSSCDQMNGNPSDCCYVNENGHPAAHLGSVISTRALSHVAAEPLESPAVPCIASRKGCFVGTWLETPGPPIYLFTHNYRIYRVPHLVESQHSLVPSMLSSRSNLYA
jgi:hypothetical protein